MNHLIRCCRGLGAALTLTLLFSVEVPAAPRAPNAAPPTLAARGWCVDDLCLGQPEAALKPYAAHHAAARPAGRCAAGHRWYAVPRTDGALEAAVDSSGRITALARGYTDAVTRAQFEHMVQESARKLAAQVVSRDTRQGATVVHLHSAALQAGMALEYAPAHALPLSVRLSTLPAQGGCDAELPAPAPAPVAP